MHGAMTPMHAITTRPALPRAPIAPLNLGGAPCMEQHRFGTRTQVASLLDLPRPHPKPGRQTRLTHAHAPNTPPADPPPPLQNPEFLDGYGSFLAEVGPQEEAVEVLQRAVAMQPESGYEKYM